MFGSELRCKKCGQYFPDRCTCQKYQSVAKWPRPDVKLGNTENISTDTHHSKEAALSVVGALKKNGFGGEGRIFPIEAYARPLPE